MSEEEKNLIRQQHTGGMKVNTERFNKLIESKSGDVKPLISEQSSFLNSLIKSAPLVGETVNFYSDPENKKLIQSQKKIKNVKKNGDMVLIDIDMDNKPTTLTWKCTSNEFKTPPTTGMDTSITMYNTNLNNVLQKTYCEKSAGGVNVPQATFASTVGVNTSRSGIGSQA